MSRLDGKTAFVTGSAQGIGAAAARRLAQDGAAVAVVDLSEGRTAEVVQQIRAAGGRAVGISCDVSDDASVEVAMSCVAKEFGSIDVLVNNAGITRDNLLFKMTNQDWEDVINVHLRGAFNCSRVAQRYMVERRWGKIVNLSSTSALGNRGQANYSAAKAGVQGLTKALAIELGPFNINVNAVAPGFIETTMTESTAARVGIEFDAMKRDVASRIPLRRVGKPEDIANVISFLCSDEASYVSSQIIYVSGGSR